jgi:hypothetical protein
VQPKLGAVIGRNKLFDVIWRVKNTGSVWLRTSVDLIYVSGARMRSRDGYDLTFSVASGEKVSLPAVRMRAPGVPGTYRATWSLRVGHENFCTLPVRIVVH